MSLINYFDRDDDRDSFWDLGFPRWDRDLMNPRHLSQQLANLQSQQLGMDLTEEKDKWVVHADLPGFSEEDVELNIENGKLAVSAKREKKFESDTGKSHRVERSFGEVRRVMRLPKGADQDKASAHLENGVLTVNFPKLDAGTEGGKKIALTKREASK